MSGTCAQATELDLGSGCISFEAHLVTVETCWAQLCCSDSSPACRAAWWDGQALVWHMRSDPQI